MGTVDFGCVKQVVMFFLCGEFFPTEQGKSETVGERRIFTVVTCPCHTPHQPFLQQMDNDDFQYEYFVNCSMSRCEVQDNFFASGVGVCNLTSQLCECPIGYSGADMWSTWNDCHINIQQRDALEYALLALAILSFSSSLLGLLTLLIKWGIIHWPQHFDDDEQFDLSASPRGGGNSSPRTPAGKRVSDLKSPPPPTPLPLVLLPEPAKLSGDQQQPASPLRRSRHSLLPRANLSELFLEPKANGTNSFQQLQAEQKRRRNTVLVVSSWLIFSASLFTFSLLRVLYKIRIEQRNHLLLLSLGSTLFFALLALWLQAYTWFSNLPSLHLFAGMFPAIKNNVLVKYPTLFRNILVVNAVMFFFICFICWWILPMFLFVQNQTLSHLIFTLSALEVAFFTIVSNAVSMILISLFRTFEGGEFTSNNGTGAGVKKKKKFGQSERTVKGMIFLTSFAGPFFVVWMLVLAWDITAYRYSVLFFCGLFLAGTLASLVSAYIFVFRMSVGGRGNKSPKNRQSSLSSRHAGQQRISKELPKRQSKEVIIGGL